VTLVGPIVAKLETLYQALASTAPYSPDAAQAGERALRNGLLQLLTAGSDRGDALATEQYNAATNMTDRYAAMAISAHYWTPGAQALLGDFRTRFGGDPLVFDKWLTASAQAPDEGVIERMRATLAAPAFPRTNSNRLRALLASFVMTNPSQFARAVGAGLRPVPAAAARMSTVAP